MEFLIFMGVILMVVGIIVFLSYMPTTLAIIGVGYMLFPYINVLPERWGGFGLCFTFLLIFTYFLLAICSICQDASNIKAKIKAESDPK